MKKTKLIIIGGFLGAGKTTLLNTIFRLLQQEGKKVGLITNDQAKGLVDTLILSSSGANVQEISGSCFCCNFDGLMQAAIYLRDIAQCDTIVAEPVGSCTDLVVTLVNPIKYYYQQYFELAPLCVLIDPFKLQQMLASEVDTKKGINYIYQKQLEEADYLVINKIDLMSTIEKAELKEFLKMKFPYFSQRWISALHKEGVKDWLEVMTTDVNVGTRELDIDYDIYADGEAAMGWYNADFVVNHTKHYLIPWGEFQSKFLQLLQELFQHEKIALQHMKIFLKSGSSELHANLTGTGRILSKQGTPFSSSSARIVVNIRAVTSPEIIKEIMDDIISVYAEEKICFETKTLNYFKPSRPEPTHR